MAYIKKTWTDRQAEYPGRRKLTATATTDVYDVTREEGLVIEEGDALNAANLNALETRIEAGLGEKANTSHSHTKGQITDFPATMAPSAHSHGVADISGVLPVAKGGTGATSLANVSVGYASSAGYAGGSGDSAKIGGKAISVQSGAPAGTAVGDLWVW